jgi:cytidylate kinase
MEGRDIGTVVYPDAAVKLFLSADPVERVARRSQERAGADVAERLRVRDARDARVNPHEPAADAVTIDTTEATPDATLEAALQIVRSRL